MAKERETKTYRVLEVGVFLSSPEVDRKRLHEVVQARGWELVKEVQGKRAEAWTLYFEIDSDGELFDIALSLEHQRFAPLLINSVEVTAGERLR